MIGIVSIAFVLAVLGIVKLPITAQHDNNRDSISPPAPNPTTEQHAEPAVFTHSEESGSASMYDFEPQMVRIPPGTFIMGSPESETGRKSDESPQRKVTIAYPFEIGRYEVTFAQYDAFANDTQRPLPDDRGWGRGDRPVINVSWHDAQAYVKWLSDKTGKKYRLPTEAEWEYVARADTSTAYWWGEAIGQNNAICNGCGSQWDAQQTAPVGSFKPNTFGVYDTASNVWEWTQDCWHGDYTNAPLDGTAWLEQNGGDCSRRVVRGGSWLLNPRILRSANRIRFTDESIYDTGFRVARDLP
jgi:formylglycine-generating enzyme required for sulfatase activity